MNNYTHVCFTWEYSTQSPWKVCSNTQLWTLAKGGVRKKVKQEIKIFYGRNGVPKSTFHSVFSISCWVGTFVWLQRKFFELNTAYTCFKFKSHSTFFIFKKPTQQAFCLLLTWLIVCQEYLYFIYLTGIEKQLNDVYHILMWPGYCDFMYLFSPSKFPVE